MNFWINFDILFSQWVFIEEVLSLGNAIQLLKLELVASRMILMCPAYHQMLDLT